MNPYETMIEIEIEEAIEKRNWKPVVWALFEKALGEAIEAEIEDMMEAINDPTM